MRDPHAGKPKPPVIQVERLHDDWVKVTVGAATHLLPASRTTVSSRTDGELLCRAPDADGERTVDFSATIAALKDAEPTEVALGHLAIQRALLAAARDAHAPQERPPLQRQIPVWATLAAAVLLSLSALVVASLAYMGRPSPVEVIAYVPLEIDHLLAQSAAQSVVEAAPPTLPDAAQVPVPPARAATAPARRQPATQASGNALDDPPRNMRPFSPPAR